MTLPLLRRVSRRSPKSVDTSTSVRHAKRGAVGLSDLFYWSSLMGADDLSKALWMRGPRPLHVALLGALLCAQVGSRPIELSDDLLTINELIDGFPTAAS